MITETEPTTLTQQDIDSIRELLPFDWRKQIQAKHPQITTRQITEVFALRTMNREHNRIVWGEIKRFLVGLKQSELARKAQLRIKQTNIGH